METPTPNRRASGVRRIELQTLVELCSLQEGGPAFEAQSLDLSGRGMRARSDYLPPLQMPLVLRFTHEAREVVVEGEVAWRQPSEAGGEFGIRFTALDSNSVAVLKRLCASEVPEPAESSAAKPAPQPIRLDSGAPVKLHLQGLAAPMKARVFESGSRLVKVGSQLEFLKLGRPLQLDLVGLDVQREARIETVDVAVDPETQIPQLLVTVRYQACGDETPEPAVIDEAANDDDFEPVAAKHRPQAAANDELDAVGEAEDEDEDTDDAEALLRSRVSVWAQQAGDTLRSTGRRLAGVGEEAAGLVNGLAGRAAASAKKKKKPTRRTTTRLQSKAVRSHVAGAAAPNLRRAPGARAAKPASGASKSARWWAAAAVLGLVVGMVVVSMGGGESEFKEQAAEFAAATSVPPGDSEAFPERATLDSDEQLDADERGIVADVPLFGPTQMAAGDPAAAGKTAEKGRGGVDEVSLAKDQSFADKPASARAAGQATDEFQVGRMHLPVIHRLRLDSPGESLQGSKTPSGFTVLIPGRKLMENGTGIARRDDRIVDVRTTNSPAGAKVTFRFRDEIPGYKARLRNDYVEFFVNSPKKK